MFEDLRPTTLPAALYQGIFVVRRLYLAFILTVCHKKTALQVVSFVMLSTFQLIYLVREQPFKKLQNFFIELFNEACILISAAQVLTLSNPATP